MGMAFPRELPIYAGVRTGALLPIVGVSAVMHAPSFWDGIGSVVMATFCIAAFWSLVWCLTAAALAVGRTLRPKQRQPVPVFRVESLPSHPEKSANQARS